MKKLLLFVLLGMLISARIMAQTATSPASGDGTSSNPYQIATLENLYWLSQTSSEWSSRFIQTADIDASATLAWDAGEGFSPIGDDYYGLGNTFRGRYNGQGHIITGLTINRPYSYTSGLFGQTVGATIENIGLSGCSINGDGLTGCLVGYADENSTIQNCYATNFNVKGRSHGIGGLIGITWNASVINCYVNSGSVSGPGVVGGLLGLHKSNSRMNNCYANVSVSGQKEIGGLAGRSENCYITDSYAQGNVIASEAYGGGLVGYSKYFYGGNRFTNCYATGTVTGGTNLGGLLGNEQYRTSITNCFYNNENFTGTTAFGIGKTTAQMKTQSTFTGWNFSSIWAIGSSYNTGYPFFVEQIPASLLLLATPITQGVTSITTSTATVAGGITAIGFPSQTECGFVWNTTGTPTIHDSRVIKGNFSEITTFTERITNLTAATKYYVRTYAVTKAGVSYSDEVNFTSEPFTAIAPAIGDGSNGNPYQIATIENLYWVSKNPAKWNKSFIQTADIYATSIDLQDNLKGWIPIGNSLIPFTGQYEGQFHIISGLTINRSEDSQGLFGYTNGAAISNLGLLRVNMTGKNNLGGLAGKIENTNINNCYMLGSITGTARIGGLIGNSISGTVENCYTAGSVTGTMDIGGLIGVNSSSAIYNCFYDTTSSGLEDTGKGTAQTTAEMKKLSTFTGWDFSVIWALSDEHNNGYPCYLNQIPASLRCLPDIFTENVNFINTSTAQGFFSINNPGMPKATSHGFVCNNSGQPTVSDSKIDLGAVVSTGYFPVIISGLTANTRYYGRTYAVNAAGLTYGNEVTFFSAPMEIIAPTSGDGTSENPYQIASLSDLYWLAQTPGVQGNYFIQTADIDATDTSSAWLNGGWTPIGTDQVSFSGHYDGQNHVIYGLSISSSEAQNQGLFGMTNGATISNLGLKQVNINGNSSVGALVGFNSSSTVSNCYASGNITSDSEIGNIGGLIGYNLSSTVNKSYAIVEINASGYFAVSGGLVGKNITSPVNNCYSTGSVAVNGTMAVAGGLIGNNDVSSVDHSYATGNVTVTGENAISGGLVGNKNNTSALILNSFYDTSTTGQTDLYGGTPKSTSEMKTQITYTDAGWDFYGESSNGEDNIWVMNPGVNNGYPILSWQYNIWNGVGNWNTAAMWLTGKVPETGANIQVASGELTISENVVVSDFTILPQASVTISHAVTVACSNLYLKSDATGTASLINRATLTVAGKTFAEHYLSANNWHIIAPTAAGGSIATFIQDATNAIPSKDISGTTSFGMMDYNEATNSWNGYFTVGTLDNLTSAKGYSIRRSNDGAVTYCGTVVSGTKTVNLSKGGTEGWNCIGNPYPSAISMNNDANSANNFLLTNSSNLDDSYACLYVWDDGAAEYKILGNSSFGSRNLGQNTFQSGQGFFVKAKDAGSSVTFNTAMQSHQPATELKSANIRWPGFGLIATTAQNRASTIVTFNNQMTTGLDVTYDAGLLRGNTGLSLYSRLVQDNGVDFAIQCLPDNYNSLVIPVGIDYKTGGEIIFSAESTELPATCNIILEDKLTKTFTELGTGATYQTNIAAGNNGTGRFYIHTSYMTTGASLLPTAGTFNLNAYAENGQLRIIGEVSASAKAHVFDLNGRTLCTYNLREGSHNSIPVTNLAPGVYLLRVTDRNNRHTSKVVIY